MRILDFAWYFMVFLVRTSFPAADTLTAGAGGATDTTQESACDATIVVRLRDRWRRRRNLRRVPTTEACTYQNLTGDSQNLSKGPEIIHFGVLYSSKTPLFDVLFLEIAFVTASR